jgi:hypothetical protein
MHRRCLRRWSRAAGTTAPVFVPRRSRRVLARDLPETALHAASCCLTTRRSAAPFTCSVAWVGEVTHGHVNHHSISGCVVPDACPRPRQRVTDWQQICRSAGQGVSERLLPLKAVAPVQIRSGLPTTTSTTRPLTWTNEGQRPCCSSDQVRLWAGICALFVPASLFVTAGSPLCDPAFRSSTATP